LGADHREPFAGGHYGLPRIHRRPLPGELLGQQEGSQVLSVYRLNVGHHPRLTRNDCNAFTESV
jgi:hypothetical protein